MKILNFHFHFHFQKVHLVSPTERYVLLIQNIIYILMLSLH